MIFPDKTGSWLCAETDIAKRNDNHVVNVIFPLIRSISFVACGAKKIRTHKPANWIYVSGHYSLLNGYKSMEKRSIKKEGRPKYL